MKNVSNLACSNNRDLSEREPEITREIHLMQKATHGLREIVETLTLRLAPVLRSVPEENRKDQPSEVTTHTQLGCQLRIEREMVEHTEQALARILDLLEV